MARSIHEGVTEAWDIWEFAQDTVYWAKVRQRESQAPAGARSPLLPSHLCYEFHKRKIQLWFKFYYCCYNPYSFPKRGRSALASLASVWDSPASIRSCVHTGGRVVWPEPPWRRWSYSAEQIEISRLWSLLPMSALLSCSEPYSEPPSWDGHPTQDWPGHGGILHSQNTRKKVILICLHNEVVPTEPEFLSEEELGFWHFHEGKRK